MRKEIRLSGTCIVPGRGIGKAYCVGSPVQESSVVTISRQDVGDQVMLFNEIKEKAKQSYRTYSAAVDGTVAGIDASILAIYEHILDDPVFIGQVVETVSSKLYDLETAIRLVSNDFIKRFNTAGTAYFRERSTDMVEVCEKLISFLHAEDGRTKTFLEPVILVVLRSFTPTDILSYDKEKIQGIICTSGGRTSHAAIIARSYSIPVISGIKNLGAEVHPGDQVILDADKGFVYVRPTVAVVSRFEKQKDQNEIINQLKLKWKRPVYTRDGIKVEVLANVSLLSDVQESIDYGADGIGLVRTEYLLSNRKNMPSEEEQAGFYGKILDRTGNNFCTIRLLDIGGDKVPLFFDMPQEFNPFMGWRAIRIFLERKDLFSAQVSAILKAGADHKYGIMIPMVTNLQEWLEAKEFITTLAGNLGIPVPPLGVLFEVPLAILEMPAFMKDVDFASIGTNDLLQYLNAADRNNSKVNYLYNPIDPAFLRIIKNAIDTANNVGKPVSICGEMAGNPHYTALLVGLGLKKFSVIPRNIPIIKELISRISYAEAAESMSHLEGIELPSDAPTWLRNLNKRMLDDALQELQIGKDM